MSNLSNPGIYLIRNTINDKFYIGSAFDIPSRWRGHLCDLRKGKHHSEHLQNAWNKYGEKSFEFRVLLYCERAELLKYEQLLIDKTNPDYNICKIAGNSSGVKRTKEAREKISEANLKRCSDPEYLQKLSDAHKGSILPIEQRKKISESLMGHEVTEETRRKIKEAQIGIPKTEEAKRKMKEGNVGRKRLPHTEETRRKISETRKQRAEIYKSRGSYLRSGAGEINV